MKKPAAKTSKKIPRARPTVSTKSRAPAPRTDPAVDEFLRRLKHPLKPDLEFLRRLILGVSPKVHEVFKWNSPSFRTTVDFATINVHGKDRLRLILHTGAKAAPGSKAGPTIKDPQVLLQWLAKDRCLVTIGSDADLTAKGPALRTILRQWIRQV